MITKTVALIVAALAVALAGCADSSTSAAAETPEAAPMVLAREVCAPASPYITVGDDGATLTIDGDGEDAAGASLEDVVCVLAALGVSDAVIARMDNTRALDGVQTGEWDGYTVSWSYHPDSGIDLIIEES